MSSCVFIYVLVVSNKKQKKHEYLVKNSFVILKSLNKNLNKNLFALNEIVNCEYNSGKN